MQGFWRSFVYAFNGIRVAIKEERNIRFHLCAAVYVFVFSLFYNFGRTEYILLAIITAGVISLELVNSALERAVSRPSPERYVTAGAVKDMAAGAVLVFSIAAAVCGVFLFWNLEVFASIFTFFCTHIVWLCVLLASIAGSIYFIFIFGKKKPNGKKERRH